MAVVEAVPFPDVEGNRDDYEILGWDMEPGDLVVFNARTVSYTHLRAHET